MGAQEVGRWLHRYLHHQCRYNRLVEVIIPGGLCAANLNANFILPTIGKGVNRPLIKTRRRERAPDGRLHCVLHCALSKNQEQDWRHEQ
jgi:hypothetical protein